MSVLPPPDAPIRFHTRLWGVGTSPDSVQHWRVSPLILSGGSIPTWSSFLHTYALGRAQLKARGRPSADFGSSLCLFSLVLCPVCSQTPCSISRLALLGSLLLVSEACKLSAARGWAIRGLNSRVSYLSGITTFHCLTPNAFHVFCLISRFFRQEGKNGWKWKSEDLFWIEPISEKQIFIPAGLSTSRIHSRALRIEIKSAKHNSLACGWVQLWWRHPWGPWPVPITSPWTGPTMMGVGDSAVEAGPDSPKGRKASLHLWKHSKGMGRGSHETVRGRDHKSSAVYLMKKLHLTGHYSISLRHWMEGYC